MNKREAIRQNEQEGNLIDLGFTRDEAAALRRISMTLRRWYELECGDGNDYGSWAIERDEETDIPYRVHHHYRHGSGKDTMTRTRIPDREKGAIRRLERILSDRFLRSSSPGGKLSYYLQTDPRGASLYIVRPGDIPEGKDVSAYYPRALCVY